MRLIRNFLVLSIYWMLFFGISRIIFFLFLQFNVVNIQLSELPLTLLYGIRLDISTTAYISALSLILMLIQVITGNTLFKKYFCVQWNYSICFNSLACQQPFSLSFMGCTY